MNCKRSEGLPPSNRRQRHNTHLRTSLRVGRCASQDPKSRNWQCMIASRLSLRQNREFSLSRRGAGYQGQSHCDEAAGHIA
eukprot:3095370-Rhodomonas_salina.1